MEPGDLLCRRFELGPAPLGSGETGVVWPALDRETGRRVAVKVLHPELAGDPEALARLREEASVAGRLRHPHLVGVLGLWSAGGGRWLLVTELAAGRDLEQLALGRPLEPRAVAALGLDLVRALEAAHRAGCVHGDVRPGHVLCGAEGARLFGFGGGRVLRAGQSAPELFAGAAPGPAADVYGLGVVLHVALAGRLPFQGDGPGEVLAAQRRGAVRVPGPSGLARLVERLLHPDPVRRPMDLAELREILAGLMADPSRRPRWRTPLAPFRPGREWVVHGKDPATGARGWVRAGLSRGAARSLARHLREHGWEVAAHREALGWSDLPAVAFLGALLGVALPVVGLPLGIRLGWTRASARAFPLLRRSLPSVRSPLPPRERPAREGAPLAAGVLLLAAAALLAASSPAVLAPLALLAALAWWSTRAPASEDPEGIAASAERSRLDSALAEARLLLDACRLPLDEALGLEGELAALEAEGTGAPQVRRLALARVEAILASLRAMELSEEPPGAVGGPERRPSRLDRAPALAQDVERVRVAAAVEGATWNRTSIS